MNLVRRVAAVAAFLVVLIVPAMIATYALSEIGILSFALETWWAVWVLLAAIGFATRAAKVLEVKEG